MGQMSYSKRHWIAWFVAGFLLLVTTGLLVPLVLYDVERPDGAIAETSKFIGSTARAIGNSIKVKLGVGADAQAGGAEISALGTTLLSTGLIDLKVSRYALLGIPRCPFDVNTPGAIEVDGDGLLLGHCSGRFYKLKLQPDISIEDTGFDLPMFWTEMMSAEPSTATQDNPSLKLLDLLRLQDGRTAVSYTRWNDAYKCFQFAVAILDLDAKPTSVKPVFEATPCIGPHMNDDSVFNGLQAGGRLVQTSDHTLLVTVGDFDLYGGVNQVEGSVQDPKSDIGKIVEIDFSTGAHRHFSTGHRNGQGLAITGDGRIFETEHGPQGGDEINLVRDGVNYGWPYETLGTSYGGGDWFLAKKRGDHSQYQKPVFAYVPSIGISQLMEARGFAEEWDGDLLVGSLKQHTLHRLRLDGDSVLYDEPILLNQRLRDMVQMPGGRIAILTDDYEIIVLEKDRDGRIQAIMAAAPEPAREALQQCLMCHALAVSDATGGRIPFTGIIGRTAASVPGVDYSPSLKAMGTVWTAETLDAFLADPERMAPGTPMAAKAVRDPELRRMLVDLIGKLSAP
ncbi:hypothetical protein DK847_02940 [Aestuariivirga litoralis]|uniref:Cytochrome c domain-containing protein n=2 Tax=Aestuariivirga litoralis TaxID=2650924 RepID=A0A2W2BRB8_9HYPH|nr:hypothetical protein DK847_02940 [Aestuariivirga litoralis]